MKSGRQEKGRVLHWNNMDGCGHKHIWRLTSGQKLKQLPANGFCFLDEVSEVICSE